MQDVLKAALRAKDDIDRIIIMAGDSATVVDFEDDDYADEWDEPEKDFIGGEL